MCAYFCFKNRNHCFLGHFSINIFSWSKRDQNLIKHVQALIKLKTTDNHRNFAYRCHVHVKYSCACNNQLCSSVIDADQILISWSRFDQTWSCLISLDQTWPGLIRLDHGYQLRVWMKQSTSWTSFKQLFNAKHNWNNVVQHLFKKNIDIKIWSSLIKLIKIYQKIQNQKRKRCWPVIKCKWIIIWIFIK